MHARYSGDPNLALRQWGKARRSEGYFGRAAALGVIRVCLSPTGETLPPPISDDGSLDASEDVEYVNMEYLFLYFFIRALFISYFYL